ncbi:MAG: ribosomal-processing cysteine protease Prp [Lachnospiraceae bacterium]|nr:ribosomal-processing cysteine protease Prp [Lachnospiraceae bacterium]
MFHVTVYVNSKEEYIGFRTKGHAGYALAGQDIVCAAASVLTINTINAIDAFTNAKAQLEADQEEGYISYLFEGNVPKEANLLLKTMVLGLTQMSHDEDYAQYIDLTFEEV